MIVRIFGVCFFLSLVQMLFIEWVSAGDMARPNMVVFLSDDHSLIGSSVYGSHEIEPPHMVRLAAEGITLELAFVTSPRCAPSRASLMTGLMPSRNGAETNHSWPSAGIKKLPAYLQELGYEVVAFGKVGHYAKTAELGFDIAMNHGFHEDVAIENAIRWLEARSGEKPLCMFVGSNWPHVPWPEDEAIDIDAVKIPAGHVDTLETRQARRRYLAAIRRMDQELGRVLEAAKRELGEETLFIHTSDHGAQWPNAKWNLYDAGIRTPMIIRWPGRVAPGVRSRGLVSWVDVLPTLIEAAGGIAPPGIDGRSMLPLLTGKTDRHRDFIFSTHTGDGNFNVYPSRSVRTSRWKYIRNLHPEFRHQSHITKVPAADSYWPSWLAKSRVSPEAQEIVERVYRRPEEELYDIAADPLESRNLIDDPALSDTLKGLREELDRWMVAQGDDQRVLGMPELLDMDRRRPNIVMVLIDDLGWSDLGCYRDGDSRTPNIDRLAGEGIRFEHYYVNSPICSPSRVALTTGQYPARHRITSFLADREANKRRGISDWLDPNAFTLAKRLKESGYAAGHFGKWHMGGQRNVGEAPLITEYGFDESLTNFEGLGARVLPLKDSNDGRPAERHALGSDRLGRGPIEWVERSMVTARYVREAIGFIDRSVTAGRPFYLNLWPDDVHSPFFPTKELRGQGGKRALYKAVLQTMDAQLKPLFDRVNGDPRLRGNTLILIASDNGPEAGAGTAEGLRGSKGELWEGGIRSPLIVWGPGLMGAEVSGRVNRTTTISAIDLAVSLGTFAGSDSLDEVPVDGENLLAALLGISEANRSRPLFWRRPPDRPGTPESPLPDLAVRDGEWKLLCRLDGKHPRLFNIKSDPGETIDVASARVPMTKRLTESVLQWNKGLPEDATSDRFSTSTRR